MASPALYLGLALIVLSYSPLISSTSSTTSSPHGLTKGSSLSVEKKDDILVSPNGVFTAGFNKVGQNAYAFAIWFSEQIDNESHTIVWMANRDTPVNGKNSNLFLRPDGNLVLRDADQSLVWSTQTKSTSNLQLQLDNTGNLVLDELPLWQSFDYPTDTLLPNQNFTKTELVSSRSSTNSSSGFYKLYFDSDRILRLRYDGPETSSSYWPDPGLRSWEVGRSQYLQNRVARLESNGQFTSSDSFRFRTADFGMGPQRMMKVDFDGNMRVYSLIEHQGRKKWEVQWVALSHPCKIHGACGPNSLCSYSRDSGRMCSCVHGHKMRNSEDWSYGCEPEFQLCEPGDEDFIELRFVEMYGYDIRLRSNTTLTACKKDCMNDCTCKGFQFIYQEPGYYICAMKTSLFNGYEQGFLSTMYIRQPIRLVSSFKQKVSKKSSFSCQSPLVKLITTSYKVKHESGSMRYMLWLGCIFGVIEILCIVLFLFHSHKPSATTETPYFQVSTGFKKFNYAELKKATGNFKKEVGRGGAGVVYKGVLSDKRIAAVKKLYGINHQGEAEFQAEIGTIWRLNHMNLIETWGYCVEGKRKLLVYEYMENGSLAENLHSGKLDWEKRFKIAIGTAKGLAYLHEECLEWVLHCDVKPQNILLDSDYNPKVADFGLSKLFDRTQIDKSSFSRIRGTRGYMAPEWVFNLPITSKVDVYSYGVVMLEMITGRSPTSIQQASKDNVVTEQTVIEWAREKIRGLDRNGSSKWVDEIVDSTIKGDYDRGTMENLIKVALHCAEEDKDARPTMSQVVNMLLHPEVDVYRNSESCSVPQLYGHV